MSRLNTALIACTVLLSAFAVGCVHAARDTTGFAVSAQTTVDVPFDVAWQGVKTALREQGLELYTRDKRGVFVAYTEMRRRYFQPKRVEYTVELTERAAGGTDIAIAAVRQVYGVTPLTYPDWHDRRTVEDPGLQAIVEAIQAHCGAQ